MQIITADYSGFCFGVERAVNIVLEASLHKKNVVTYGPIIHNPQVVAELEKKGISVVDSTDGITKNMTVVIRSHGVEKNTGIILREKAGEVIDAACPFVLKAQNQAAKLSEECDAVIILGEKEHPEVRGIISYAKGEYFVIADCGEAEKLPYRKSYGFLAQTTQNNEIFKKISAILKNKCENLKAVNTICNATERRQNASVSLASQVEVMVVIGGKNSANTTRLCHLCSKICGRTYHIETPEELTKDMFDGVTKVGITAGASTPKNFICKVREYILEVSK